MREAILKIAAEHRRAVGQPLAGHPLARFIRRAWPVRLATLLPARFRPYLTHAGAGAGAWAQVPWAAVFDPAVTETATAGYFVAYLVSADGERLVLSLTQGAEAAHALFGDATAAELGRRATRMRERIAERAPFFPFDAGPIHLAAHGPVARAWEAAHALGRTYAIAELPDDAALGRDLAHMLGLYALLRAQGGVRPAPALIEDAAPLGPGAAIGVRKALAHHRAIERDAPAAARALALLGPVCQGCGFDFEAVYGEAASPRGRRANDGGRALPPLIEIHHLTPPILLADDGPVALDPKRDFAALCPNCHRLMHRPGAPAHPSALRRAGQVAALEKTLKSLRNALL